MQRKFLAISHVLTPNVEQVSVFENWVENWVTCNMHKLKCNNNGVQEND